MSTREEIYRDVSTSLSAENEALRKEVARLHDIEKQNGSRLTLALAAVDELSGLVRRSVETHENLRLIEGAFDNLHQAAADLVNAISEVPRGALPKKVAQAYEQLYSMLMDEGDQVISTVKN